MTGNKIIDNALVALGTLASFGALGIFVYTTMIFKRPLPNDTIEKVKLIQDSKNVVFANAFKLDKLIVNLPSKRGRLRFLDIEVHLVPFQSIKTDFLEQRKPIIQDAVIQTSSSMEPQELNSITGKILLENRLKNRINEILGREAIKKILFSRFVVQ